MNKNSHEYLSEIELKILRAQNPLEINTTDEINYNNEKYIWVNRKEVEEWQGPVPVDKYSINEDTDPLIIRKKSNKELKYIQEMTIRYLKPPTPVSPPPIIIKQESNTQIPAGPPLVIRQIPEEPKTPEPLVIRENPPQPPPKYEPKVITIRGKNLPPPPRKIVIEKLPPLPPKPPTLIVERWLPYENGKRRVIFQKSKKPTLVVPDPKNVIVHWETPEVEVEKSYKILGVVEADPTEYAKKYKGTLKKLQDYPELEAYLKNVERVKEDTMVELEGDVEALGLVDLDKEGLSQYKNYLNKRNDDEKKNFLNNNLLNTEQISSLKTSNKIFYNKIYDQFKKCPNEDVSYNDARDIFVKYSAKHGRKLSDNDFKNLIKLANLESKRSFNSNELKKILLKANF
ncbi:unnamed protein product [Brachionus calyciflorus]|uniref:Uncharacterized protein n=1 Tax=Brachionus calyciflorus TaxID=104777 RepID=A0A814LW58_9BILA|nr:unnamed protein product [Brachionus calyciflorus]